MVNVVIQLFFVADYVTYLCCFGPDSRFSCCWVAEVYGRCSRWSVTGYFSVLQCSTVPLVDFVHVLQHSYVVVITFLKALHIVIYNY